MYGFGNEQEAAFQKDLNKFAQANGFTVKFTKAASWDTEIRARVAGGNPPDVGLFPQPGVMLMLEMRWRIASTAAPSALFLSPRPTHRPAAIAAASVTRTSSRARLRSGLVDEAGGAGWNGLVVASSGVGTRQL